MCYEQCATYMICAIKCYKLFWWDHYKRWWGEAKLSLDWVTYFMKFLAFTEALNIGSYVWRTCQEATSELWSKWNCEAAKRAQIPKKKRSSEVATRNSVGANQKTPDVAACSPAHRPIEKSASSVTKTHWIIDHKAQHCNSMLLQASCPREPQFKVPDGCVKWPIPKLWGRHSTQGASTNNIRKIFGFFDPLPICCIWNWFVSQN